jgi:protein-tyrosine phosphatase
VPLPDGTVVRAASFRKVPEIEEYRPDFGLYLDHRWQPPWPHQLVAWPDFGVPSDDAELRELLVDGLERARRGEVVEIGCLGGHGRTGSALACMAVLAGLESDPVEWVRAAFCDRAVETDEQMAFVRAFH